MGGPLTVTGRLLRGPFGPALFLVWPIWLVVVCTFDLWRTVADNLGATATMFVGAFIAGATAEGGGAIAFPVFTLGLGISSEVARDFSFLIQAVGMSAATLAIIAARIPVCWRMIGYASLGGLVGTTVSILFLQPRLSPAHVKLFFVSLWIGLGFALALIYLQSRRRDLPVLTAVPLRTAGLGLRSAPLLVAFGVVGGVVSGLVGTGLDLLTFSVCVLLFGLDERVGTPSSVVLMALNSLHGATFLGLVRPLLVADAPGLSPQALDLWLAAIPAVTLMAPVGAFFIRGRSRLFVLGILWTSMVVQYVGALLIVPGARTTPLLALSATTIVLSLVAFGLLARGRLANPARPAAST
jgi:uncharacterized membrane protein YfcA